VGVPPTGGDAAVLEAVVRPRDPKPHRAAEEVRPQTQGLSPWILSHCRWPLHTSLLEGINNKFKVIKRMAYGFRDDEYFLLKTRAAFPGVP
jgi:transposase